jgi:anti-sigma factor RsiW
VTIDVDDRICDAEAARLLPWFVNGRLSAADAERVTQHLERCDICRADLAEQRGLRAVLRTVGSVEYAPQAGLAKTLSRIDELARDPAPAAEDRGTGFAPDTRRRRFGATQWLAAAVVVQAVGLGAIGGAALVRHTGQAGTAGYETLSTPVPVAAVGRIRAVFAESMTVGELKALLAAQHLLIVAGPSDAGVFTLGAAAASGLERLDAPLAGLRAEPRVLFAEPVAGAGAAPR